jgi:hypothetical protein
MKNIFKTFLIGLVLIGTTVSCEDSTLAIDELYDTVDMTGAFVRTLDFPADLIYLTDDGSGRTTSIDMVLEVQEGNGSLPPSFTELRVFVAVYDDQDLLIPTSDDQGNPLGENLVQTIPASEFVLSEGNNLPSTDVSITAQFVADLYPTAVFTIPTFIATRLELEMADGRVITNTNVGPSVATGDYFASPFLYKTIFLNF